MSSYTIELRKIAEIYTEEAVKGWFMDYNLEDYLTQDQIADIQTAGIWSKEKLAQKIYDHYYMREIGLETPYLFKHFAKVKMQELMEAKLPVIWSNCIEYNPLVNVDYEEVFERHIKGENANNSTTGNNESVNEIRNNTTNGASTSTSSSSSSGLNVNSDTPQGQISKQAILGGSYASSTSATEAESSSNAGTQTQETSNISDSIARNGTGTFAQLGSDKKDEEYSKKVKGNSGVMATAQKLIQQYRDIIVAVDRDIIEELDSLFIGLY